MTASPAPPSDAIPPAGAAVIARLRLAPVPWAFSVLLVLAVAAASGWGAFFPLPGEAAGRPFLLLPAALAIWFALRLVRARGTGLELTAVELRDTSGRVLAPVADILAVDRGAFAFKPSGGFVLRLTTKSRAAWAPGLWWRFGNRVGVGGATLRPEARAMADAIAMQIAGRRD